MKNVFKYIFLAFAMVFLAACDRAPSNVVTLQTENCGKNWKVIPTGERIPNQTTNYCGYNITMPDYPMQGDTEFLTQFSNHVLVRVQMSYDYEISDPLVYIDHAKFLGKMNGSVKDSNASENKQYETAENVVIDVRIREIITSATGNLDIVSFNPSEFEDKMFTVIGAELKKRGVTINSMTFVILPEEQTRTAIDAATAMAIYQSKGLGDLGKEIAVAKAGAARIYAGGNHDK